jgi:hypothetical protein
LKDEKINQNTELSAAEISAFDTQSVIFLNHRSVVLIDNFLLTTEYSVIVTSDLFFTIIDDVPRQTNLTNLEIQINGGILITAYPTQLYFAHSRVDYYKTKTGIWSTNA